MRTITTSDLAQRLSALPGQPRVVMTGNHAVPETLLDLVDKSMASYTLHMLNAPVKIADREGVVAESCFVGTGMRRNSNLRYIPCRLSMVPLLFSRTLPPDVVIVHCAPARDGHVSLGIETNILPAAIEAARARGGMVVAAVNPQMPYTFGDAQISVEDIDFAVDYDSPLAAAPVAKVDESAQTIGAAVSAMVADGSTLQMGIGAVPDAVLQGLKARKGLKVWSEMFSDGVLEMLRLGAIDGDAPLVASFSFGSRELYEWMDGNPQVRMLRTEKTNDPALIAKQPKMVSINTALQVDLFGRANAARIGKRIHSGFGGQTDFIVGALHSQGGQSFMALRSWHPKANVSTIVAQLEEPTTSFQQSYIVTEQGTAKLFGYSQLEQVTAIIDNAAHPDVRASLWEAAAELGVS